MQFSAEQAARSHILNSQPDSCSQENMLKWKKMRESLLVVVSSEGIEEGFTERGGFGLKVR